MKKPTRPQAGFSLVELLGTLVVLSMIMGTTVLFFQNQNKSFIKGSEKMDLLQNARYTMSHMERLVRTLGAGVTGQQPMMVYGGDDVIAFNSDYLETDTTNFRWAVNFNPSMTAVLGTAWTVGTAGTIPNTAYTYPAQTFLLGNGSPSPAETKMFWFVPDSATSRTDDYALWERTNAGTAEYIARNILAYPGRPFIQYFLARRLGTGLDTLIIASGGCCPSNGWSSNRPSPRPTPPTQYGRTASRPCGSTSGSPMARSDPMSDTGTSPSCSSSQTTAYPHRTSAAGRRFRRPPSRPPRTPYRGPAFSHWPGIGRPITGAASTTFASTSSISGMTPPPRGSTP